MLPPSGAVHRSFQVFGISIFSTFGVSVHIHSALPQEVQPYLIESMLIQYFCSYYLSIKSLIVSNFHDMSRREISCSAYSLTSWKVVGEQQDALHVAVKIKCRKFK